MTIDRMAPTIAELDLAGAAVLMFGRAAELDRAFAVLGRMPTHIHLNPDDDDSPSATLAKRPLRDDGDDDDDDVRPSDLTDALTEQPPPRRLALSFMPGYATAASLSTRRNVDVSGYNIGGAIAFRLTESTAIGLRLSIGSLDGTYEVGTKPVPDLRPIAVVPFSIGAYSLATLNGRVFGGAFLTLHFARITDDQLAPVLNTSVGLGAECGLDIVRLGLHQLGVFGRVETQLGAADVVPMFSLGLAYRR